MEEGMEWLCQSLVRSLKDVVIFDKLQDVFFMEKNRELKLRYLGDKLVLIFGMGEKTSQERIEKGDEGFISLFHSIRKWSP